MSQPGSRDQNFALDVHARLDVLVSALPQGSQALVLPLNRHVGKGIRSHLVEVCSRFGRPRRVRLVRLAAVIELLHLASLLHDDVIDRAAVRRGHPAAHVVAGQESAVLAGAACLARAAQEAADLGPWVSRALAVVTAELAYGELLDVERAFDITFKVGGYLELVRRKTAELFRLACVFGAAVAGVDAASVNAVAAFGIELGIAFQIMDDCLDLQADPGGKPAGTDHLLGLFGFPTLHALQQGAAGLAELLLSPSLTVEDLPRIRTMIADAGGLIEARAAASRHFDRAVSALGPLAGTAPGAALAGMWDVLWPN
jgi:heptaprenyl diphosphate synthase